MTTRGDVCAARGCAACCHDTEMILTEEDAERLAALGHAREDFSEVDASGYLTLRNVEDAGGRHCYFLENGKCSVYADRPVGCRWYPVIINVDGRVVRDEDCPHRREFPVPPGAGRKLLRIMAVVQREAARR